MIRKATLALTLVLVMPAAFAAQITQEYEFDAPTVTSVTIDDAVWDRVVMDGATNGGSAGEPAMPATGARILIPYGETVTNVTVTASDPVLVGSGYNIEPVQQPMILSADASLAAPLTPDAAIYSSNAAFPAVRLETQASHNFRGYQILILRLRPAEYRPLSGELSYFPKLTVTVTTEPSGKAPTLYRGTAEDAAELAGRVDNIDVALTYASMPQRTDKSYDLLIVTHFALVDAFLPLKEYHNANGISTEIHTTVDIGSNHPDSLRAYITDQYLNHGIGYVLIGGDHDIIPSKTLYVLAWGGDDPLFDYAMPTEHYFGCLDGPYNGDGDGAWGEPNDGEGGGDVDLIAEVYVGRASVGSADEAVRFVNKTLAYLNTEDSDPYLDRVIMAGEHLSFSGWGEYGGYALDEIIDVSDAHGYTTYGSPSASYDIDRLYDMTWTSSASWPVIELVNRINGGIHIINHYGHCNYTWGMKMTAAQSEAYFTNEDPFFLFSQGCNAGGFDQGDCWAESATIKTDHGAFAVVMNTRYGLGHRGTDGPSQRYDREFFDALYNPSEAKLELGRATQDCKEDNIYRVNESGMRWCHYEITLFGDPTVRLREVSALTLSCSQALPEMVAPDTETSFEFYVGPVGSGTPLAGSGLLAHSLNDNPWQTASLTQVKSDTYSVTLPAIQCGDTLRYQLQADETGGQTFYFPTNSPTTLVASVGELTLFEDDFEADKGWTISGGQWARGIPTGAGGEQQQYGGEDPTEGCNGPNVMGYNLYGNYANNLPAYHVTSPEIDCGDMSNVRVSYCRWLGVEQAAYDHASLSASVDGISFTTVWENSAIIVDNAWETIEHDISAIAAFEKSVFLRWTMGSTDGGSAFCGWNIDDLRVTSYDCPPPYICGDIDADELGPNIGDLVYLVTYMFQSGPAPLVAEACDMDGAYNGVDVSDLVHMVNYMFNGGDPLDCP